MISTILMPLDKIAELCRIIDVFSADAHFDYQIVRFAQNKQDLLAKAEQYDIRNEELFNQFEAFLSGYKALASALGISSESLSDESMQELGDLTNTLETRYERLQNNGYLTVSADEGYDEDFDPADFRELIADMMEDANSRFQMAAGDIDISQLKGLEIAKDLNQEALDRGDDKMRWTGDKVQQQLEARQKHLDQVKFRRKFAKDSPEYQRLIETSRRNYRTIMADPERREAYRKKSRSRQRVWYGKEEKRTQVVKERAKQLTEKKKESTLSSFIIHLTQRLASLKSDKVKAIKKSPPPQLRSFIEATRAAKKAMETDPTTGGAALETAIKREDQALREHMKEFIETLMKLYALRDKLKQLDGAGWLELTPLPNEVRQPITDLAKEILSAPKMGSRGIAEISLRIAELIKGKLDQ